MRWISLSAALLGLAPLAPAIAGMPVTETMTCPIGGKPFEFTTTASYSTWGERPDGKPYGSWVFPLAIPECPDNGLVLYKEYDEEEVAKLEPLVASEAYQALRESDTTYYRAYWLMKEMGVGPERYLWALLQAGWQAEGDLRRRYLAELAEATGAVEPKPDDLNWIGMEGRAINALRELGRFDEALERLDRIPLETLEATLATGEENRSEQRKAWAGWFRKLRAVIERQDSGAEPFDMLPTRISLGRCADEGETLDEHQKAFCERESAAVDELKQKRADIERQLETVARPRDESGR